MNPFSALDALRQTYRTYIHTFQRIQNPVIRDWVGAWLESGSLLWREPFVQLNRRCLPGKSFDAGMTSPAQGLALARTLLTEAEPAQDPTLRARDALGTDTATRRDRAASHRAGQVTSVTRCAQ